MKSRMKWKSGAALLPLAKSAAGAVLVALFLLALQPNVTATLKYKKDTGKKCLFCHTGIPRPGDEDPQLNADGKKFRENGYKLTEEQQRKPDPVE